mgnify:CR=1 FL=1
MSEPMTELSKLTELRKLMQDMERSMGLQELSSVERDVYYAASDVAQAPSPVKTTLLQDHALMKQVSRPTFFRALKSLVSKGYLEQCKNSTRGYYIVKDPR